MTRRLPSVHHVVFCLQPDHLDAAAEYWRDLGFEFTEFLLDDVGLRVLLDWGGGVELIAPVDGAGPEAERYRAHLRDQGQGVYSVCVRVPDVDGPRNAAARHGAAAEFEQDRRGKGYRLNEVQLGPVHGISVTLLATDLPD
jgi:hypothetical protein